MTISTRGSWGSYNLRNLLGLINRHRCDFSNVCRGHSSSSTVAKLGRDYSIHQWLQLISANGRTRKKIGANIANDDNIKPPPPAPDKFGPPAPGGPRFNFPPWARWVLGSILSILLPFWKLKWEKLKRIEGEAEIIVEEVENVAGVVEKVAMAAEKVSAEVAEKLPENGKLKEAALLVEHVSKATAHDAQVTKDFIHKVERLKHDFDDLETMVEPVTDKIVHEKSEAK